MARLIFFCYLVFPVLVRLFFVILVTFSHLILVFFISYFYFLIIHFFLFHFYSLLFFFFQFFIRQTQCSFTLLHVHGARTSKVNVIVQSSFHTRKSPQVTLRGACNTLPQHSTHSATHVISRHKYIQRHCHTRLWALSSFSSSSSSSSVLLYPKPFITF